jgi:hypothetical protein
MSDQLAITEDDIDDFMAGGCHALAIALNRDFGLPIIVFWSEGLGRLVPAHVCNIMPNQQYLDIRGMQDAETFGQGYSWCYGDQIETPASEVYALTKVQGEAGLPIITQGLAQDADQLARILMSQPEITLVMTKGSHRKLSPAHTAFM